MPLIKLLLVLTFTGMIPTAKENFSEPAIEKTTSYQTFFSYIRCHRQAKNIVINWGTTSLNNVHHFVVYHSELGDFFDPIAEVYPDGALKYSVKHELVLPGYHYYYIKVVMNAGPAADSPVDVVRIVGH